jgi:hypothetical protein
MKHQDQVRIASLLTALLGVWVLLSPLVISVTGAALVNIIGAGIILAALGVMQLFIHNSVPSWFNGFVGMWLVVSAFVFTVSSNMAANMIISGLVGVILALWDTNEVEETYHPVRA